MAEFSTVINDRYLSVPEVCVPVGIPFVDPFYSELGSFKVKDTSVNVASVQSTDSGLYSFLSIIFWNTIQSWDGHEVISFNDLI